MPIDDPTLWIKGAAALKTGIEMLRSAIGLVNDARSIGGGTEQQQKAIDTTLATAKSSIAIAEVEIAKALGYQLCRCEFPPTVMLTVGYFNRDLFEDGRHEGDPVYECPKCGYTNAGPYLFARLKA